MEDCVASIGPKIRQLRRQKNLSLQQLSERSGLSTATIHKIEHSGMTPTVATLMKLAAALNRSVAYFIDEEESPPAVLVRSDERKPLFSARDGLDLLAVSGPAVHLGAVEHTPARRGGPGRDRAPHRPELLSGRRLRRRAPSLRGVVRLKESAPPLAELVFTLDGMLSFEVGGEEYMLRRGDALHFRTDRPHRWRNSGRRPARALWMVLRSP